MDDLCPRVYLFTRLRALTTSTLSTTSAPTL